MKLLRLDMRNLASLQGDNTIHFEEGVLKDCQIFSIVGPTGSGKSSILDAICLALYGRAPRYDSRKKDGTITDRQQSIEIIGESDEQEKNRLAPTDPRNILTKNQKECYSRLTFLANNGHTYRSEWSVTFRRTQYAKAETHLYRIDPVTGQEYEDKSDVQTIIGLDFDQFLRTVLIAQGSFAGFLKADEEERYQLLEKLIGNGEVYKQIAEAIKARKAAAEDAYKTLKANCGARENDIMNQDDLAALNEQIQTLETYQQQYQQIKDQLKEALKWYADARDKQQRIDEAKRKMDAATTACQLQAEPFSRLAVYDATHEAVAAYREMTTRSREAEDKQKELQTLSAAIAQLLKDMQQADNLLKTLQSAATSAEKLLKEQQPHINAARILKSEVVRAEKYLQEKTAEQQRAREALTKAAQAVADNAVAIKKAEAALKAAQDHYAQKEQQVTHQQKALQQAAQQALEALEKEKQKQTGKDATALQKAVNEAQQALTDIEAAIRIRGDWAAKTAEQSSLQAKQLRLTQRNAALTAQLQTLTIASLQQDVEALQRTHTLMVSEQWQQHRSLLRDEAPCPLCGAVHHPYAEQADYRQAAAVMDEQLRAKQAALKQQTDNQTLWQTEKATNEGELKDIPAKLTRLKEEILHLDKDWLALHTRYPQWQADKAALEALKPGIEQGKKQAEEALQAYNAVEQQIHTLQQRLMSAQNAQTQYDITAQMRGVTDARNAAHTTLQTEKGKTQNLLEQQKTAHSALEVAKLHHDDAALEVTTKRKRLQAEIGDQDPDTYEQTLQQDLQQATKKVTDQKELIARLQKLQGEKEGSRNTLNSAIDTLKKTIAAQRTQLADWLAAYNARPECADVLQQADIQAIAEDKTDWEKVRAEQTRLTRELTATTQTHDDCKKDLTKHQDTRPKDEEAALIEQQQQHEQLSKESELISCKAQLQKHNDAVVALGPLKEQLQQASEHYTDCKELLDAVGGDGKNLRKMAQCYTLSFLVEEANKQIMLFKGRYQLMQVPNSLGMRVIDKERFDEIRETTSLSGGETFIVSLGLALGLSSLASRNTAFEDLFVDEGFGTLDADLLAIVIEALSRINMSQGKKVGVISHTEAMSQDIPTQIKVLPNHDGTSRIEVGYNLSGL